MDWQKYRDSDGHLYSLGKPSQNEKHKSIALEQVILEYFLDWLYNSITLGICAVVNKPSTWIDRFDYYAFSKCECSRVSLCRTSNRWIEQK